MNRAAILKYLSDLSDKNPMIKEDVKLIKKQEKPINFFIKNVLLSLNIPTSSNIHPRSTNYRIAEIINFLQKNNNENISNYELDEIIHLLTKKGSIDQDNLNVLDGILDTIIQHISIISSSNEVNIYALAKSLFQAIHNIEHAFNTLDKLTDEEENYIKTLFGKAMKAILDYAINNKIELRIQDLPKEFIGFFSYIADTTDNQAALLNYGVFFLNAKNGIYELEVLEAARNYFQLLARNENEPEFTPKFKHLVIYCHYRIIDRCDYQISNFGNNKMNIESYMKIVRPALDVFARFVNDQVSLCEYKLNGDLLRGLLGKPFEETMKLVNFNPNPVWLFLMAYDEKYREHLYKKQDQATNIVSMGKPAQTPTLFKPAPVSSVEGSLDTQTTNNDNKLPENKLS